MLRTAQSLPLKGLSTLGFDPARFQTEPPACYRASWQLPGPDSHRQATTSLSTSDHPKGITSISLGARNMRAKRSRCLASRRWDVSLCRTRDWTVLFMWLRVRPVGADSPENRASLRPGIDAVGSIAQVVWIVMSPGMPEPRTAPCQGGLKEVHYERCRSPRCC